MFLGFFLPSSPTKIMVVAYFSLPLLDVDADVIVGDPAVDFVEEVDGVVHRSIEDVAAAIELLGHDAKVPCQRMPIIAERGFISLPLTFWVYFHETRNAFESGSTYSSLLLSNVMNYE